MFIQHNTDIYFVMCSAVANDEKKAGTLLFFKTLKKFLGICHGICSAYVLEIHYATQINLQKRNFILLTPSLISSKNSQK